jgi:hypothetical protein
VGAATVVVGRTVGKGAEALDDADDPGVADGGPSLEQLISASAPRITKHRRIQDHYASGAAAVH